MAVNLGLLHLRKHTDILFANRVLRKILGPKEGKVTEDWRKLQNEELHGLSSSPNTGWRKKNAWFSNNCNFVCFQYKKLCQHQNNL